MPLNKKIKILFVIGHFGTGGKERQLAEMIKNLPGSKYELSFFAKSFDNCYFDQKTSDYVKAFVLGKANFSLGDVFSLNKIINQVQPDIIFSWATITSHMVALTRFFPGKKKFVLLNGSIRSAPVSFTGLLRIERFLYRFYRYVVSNSAAGLRAFTQNESSGRFILPNGFDFSRIPEISKAEARMELNLPSDKFIVPMVARIDRAKDHKTFIDAVKLFVAENENCLFLIVGDGYLREYYENCVQDLGLEQHICFLGNRADVEKIFIAADISVLISTAHRGEGLSNSIIESLAARTPVIVTDNPGNRELLKEGTCGGLIVECGNAQALMKKMAELYNTPDLMKKMSLCGYSMVKKKYSVAAMLKTVEEIFNQILV